MRGTIHQAVNRARLLLLAVALLLFAVPTAQAIRCPTPGPALNFLPSRLNEEMPGQKQSRRYKVWAVDSEGCIGLFVGNNPISNVDPLGLEGNPISSTLPGLNGRWNSDASGGAGSFYGPGFYQSLAIQHADAKAAAQAAAIAAHNATVPSDFQLGADGYTHNGLQSDPLGDMLLGGIGPALRGSAFRVCPSNLKPPGWNSRWVWKPAGTGKYSRTPRWFSEEGNQWRWHNADKYHTWPHWDYKPVNGSWLNADESGNLLLPGASTWP